MIVVDGSEQCLMIGVSFSVFIAGFVAYFVSRYMRNRQGIDLELVFNEIPPE